jgi:PKD repeat protein
LIIPILLSFSSHGYNSYTNDIQGPLSGDCNVCHVTGDLTSLNSYGLAFENFPNHASIPAEAIEGIAGLDSDGDGYTNGWELEKGTNPGDAAAYPPPDTLPKAAISQPGEGSVYGTGLLIIFNGSTSNDEFGVKAGITTHDWDFGDGNSQQGSVVTYSYSSENTYIVTLTVTSVGGLIASNTRSIIVSNIDVNVKPIAIITGESSINGSLGAPITLDGSESYDPNDDSDNNGLIDGGETDNLTYAWDFGDGTSVNGKTVEHEFSSTGILTITLTVTDSGFGTDETFLSDSDSISIEIFRPTLQIVNLTKSTSKPQIEGNKLILYGKIFNSGDGDAVNVTASLYHEDEAVQVLTDITIMSSETRSIVFWIYPEAGNHEYDLTVTYAGGSTTDKIYIHVEAESNSTHSLGSLVIITLIFGVALCLRLVRNNKRGGEGE